MTCEMAEAVIETSTGSPLAVAARVILAELIELETYCDRTEVILTDVGRQIAEAMGEECCGYQGGRPVREDR